jgi:hypothetical protein
VKQLEKMYVFERDNYLIIILKNVMSEAVVDEVLQHHLQVAVLLVRQAVDEIVLQVQALLHHQAMAEIQLWMIVLV